MSDVNITVRAVGADAAATELGKVATSAQAAGPSAERGAQGMGKMAAAGMEASRALQGMTRASEGSVEGVFALVTAARNLLASLSLAALNPIIMAIAALAVPFLILKKKIEENRAETERLKKESADLAVETRKIADARFDRLLGQYDELIRKEESAYEIASKLARLEEDKKDARTRIALTKLEIQEKQALAQLAPDDKEGREFVSLGYQQRRAEVELARDTEKSQAEVAQRDADVTHAQTIAANKTQQLHDLDLRLQNTRMRRATILASIQAREAELSRIEKEAAEPPADGETVEGGQIAMMAAQRRAERERSSVAEFKKESQSNLTRTDQELADREKQKQALQAELDQLSGRIEEAKAAKELAVINQALPPLSYQSGYEERLSRQRDAQIQWTQAREKEAEAVWQEARQRDAQAQEAAATVAIDLAAGRYSQADDLSAQRLMRESSDQLDSASAHSAAIQATRASIAAPTATVDQLLLSLSGSSAASDYPDSRDHLQRAEAAIASLSGAFTTVTDRLSQLSAQIRNLPQQ